MIHQIQVEGFHKKDFKNLTEKLIACTCQYLKVFKINLKKIFLTSESDYLWGKHRPQTTSFHRLLNIFYCKSHITKKIKFHSMNIDRLHLPLLESNMLEARTE